MPRYLAALMVILLIGTVLGRVLLLKRTGTRAMHFGKLDNTDFAIPPVALFYFYTVFAVAFGWPVISTQRFFRSTVVAWIGVGLCAAGVVVLLLSLVSFGKSFRVGIDVEKPGRLITNGHLRGEPQPDLCRLFSVPGRPIFGVPQLGSTALPGRGYVAVPSPGTKGRGILARALRQKIPGVLQPRQTLSLSPASEIGCATAV